MTWIKGITEDTLSSVECKVNQEIQLRKYSRSSHVGGHSSQVANGLCATHTGEGDEKGWK